MSKFTDCARSSRSSSNKVENDLIARSNKKRLRAELKALRAGWDPVALSEIDEMAMARLLHLPELDRAENVFCFLGAHHLGEQETEPLIASLQARGKTVGIPFISSTGADGSEPRMEARVFEGRSSLVRNEWGLLEPTTATLPKDQVDLAIVPCLGISTVGHRIGFGKAYYDRYLRNCACTTVCLSRDFALIAPFETDTYDVRMDVVVTERRVVRFV